MKDAEQRRYIDPQYCIGYQLFSPYGPCMFQQNRYFYRYKYVPYEKSLAWSESLPMKKKCQA